MQLLFPDKVVAPKQCLTEKVLQFNMKIYGDHLGNAYHPKKFRSKTHSMISYGLIWSLIQRLRGFVQWIIGCGYLSGQIWNMRLATFCFSDAIHLCDLSDRTASLWFNNYKLARNEYVKFKIKMIPRLFLLYLPIITRLGDTDAVLCQREYLVDLFSFV